MGKLRQIGRKIKKGVKSLFSSQIGAMIGTMALSMIFGPMVSRAFNGLKGAVMGTGATSATAPATATASANAANVAAAEAGGTAATQSLLSGGAKKLTTKQLVAGETIQSVASQQALGTQVSQEALTTAFGTGNIAGQEALKASIDQGKIMELITSGTIPPDVSNTVTGSLENFNKYLQSTPSAKQTITKGNINTINLKSPLPDKISMNDIQQTRATGEANIQAAKDTKLFGDEKLLSDTKQNFTDFKKGVGEFIDDPAAKTKNLVGDNFVGDVGKSVLSGAALMAMQGDTVDQGGYGRVATQPANEGVQAQYMKEVGPSYMAATGATQLPSFAQMSQQVLYGPGAPQSFYTELPTPTIGRA